VATADAEGQQFGCSTQDRLDFLGSLAALEVDALGIRYGQSGEGRSAQVQDREAHGEQTLHLSAGRCFETTPCNFLKGSPDCLRICPWFTLQCLVNAARLHKTCGIFVAFEESPSQIIANGATFDWGLAGLVPKKLFVMDAHLSPTLVTAGDFDLAGLLAMLAAKQQEIGAQWIVFDGIDVLLTLLQDPAAEMGELYRLRDWLADTGLTAIVTATRGTGGVLALTPRVSTTPQMKPAASPAISGPVPRSPFTRL